MEYLINDKNLKEELRGPQGTPGKDGFTGAPGLTVIHFKEIYCWKAFTNPFSS